MPNQTRTAIFVLGMHRSGTSALTRVLNLCGAELPTHVLEANSFNPKGYWEPKSIVKINDDLLDQIDACWDGPFTTDQHPSKRLSQQHKQMALDGFYDAFGTAGEPVIVVKDPRCTLITEFWADIARAAEYEPKYVGIYRTFSGVAKSLALRDEFSAEEAGLLWSFYGIKTLKALYTQRSPLISYSQLTSDWQTCLNLIDDKLELGLKNITKEQVSQIDDFIDIPRSNEIVDVSPEISEIIDAVERAYKEYESDFTIRDLSEVEKRIVELSGLSRLSIVRHKRLEVKNHLSLVDDLKKAREAISNTENRLSGERDKARRDFKNADARAVRWKKKSQDFEQDYNSLNSDFKSLEISLASYLDYISSLEGERDKARSDFNRVESERLEFQSQRDSLAARLRALESSTLWRISAPVRFVFSRLPWISVFLRRVLKLSYWAISGQLIARLKARWAANEEAKGVGTPHTISSINTSLSDFLSSEFSNEVADRIQGLIDHYGLQFQTEASPPINFEIDTKQVEVWAKAIAKIAPKPSMDPAVSIIIPAYNQIAYTLACIDSIMRSKPECRFEILVGDDLSNDGTERASKIAIPGVRWIRHQENQGFVGNCNLTAAEARGRYVAFLNNDTLVLPGWLDELITTLDHDPNIGLVGSKLIYPDGRLQEAGGIFWQDGSAWNFGRLDDPRRPEFSYARDVDYISGASIVLPKKLWDELNGFDEIYRPAYAEDADLAFRVRDNGLRTVLQSRSMLLHFEGVTSGTDLNSGAKAYQVTNLEKLKHRWANVLKTHRPNGVEPHLEKERAVTKRALFIDVTTPEPQHDAGSVVAVETMHALQALGYKVSFVPQDNFLWTRTFSVPLQAHGIEVIYHPFYSRFEDFMRARGDEFELVFVHRFAAAERTLSDIARYAPKAKIAFMPADLHYLREEREAALLGDDTQKKSAAETRKREFAVMKNVDAVLPHSTVEAELLTAGIPDISVYHYPLIHDPEPTQHSFNDRIGVGFIGGFGHPPNLDAVDWFLETVWPLVRADNPEAKFILAGSKMPDRLKALNGQNGIDVLGFVDSLPAYFNQIRLSVAPLRYGAGAKGKVAASLAYGTPCVTTSIGAEGMGLVSGQHIDVGDAPEDMAKLILNLLNNEEHWLEMRQSGLEFAKTSTSRAVIRSRIKTILNDFDLG